MKEYTTKDTLNSISWQLKRIADALEELADQNKLTTKESKPNSEFSSKLIDFINRQGDE